MHFGPVHVISLICFRLTLFDPKFKHVHFIGCNSDAVEFSLHDLDFEDQQEQAIASP